MNYSDLIAAVRGIIKLNQRLIAVTEQRDGFEAKLRTELRGHPDSELWGDAGLIAATMRCVDAHDEAIEQRDEWKEKFIQQNKDLGCEMMDPNGTIWDHAKKVQLELNIVAKQRDRLAELLSDIYNYAKGKKPHDYHKMPGSSDQLIAKFDAWQEIECKIEELLQTTPTQPEPK